MIVCPNCNHPNPEGAAQCEACYTPLPATTRCPHCGAPVQTDAGFCGQCGSSLRPTTATEVEATVAPGVSAGMPDLVTPEPLVQPEPLESVQSAGHGNSSPASDPMTLPATAMSSSVEEPATSAAAITPPSPPSPSPAVTGSSKTQLQQQTARLLHVQTDTVIELPQNLSVVHIGKSNDRIPPDVDVSGFPNSEVVSRVHADIRVEGDSYYIEDVGSSNGTYVNNMPMPPGNRHRLRPGDRIALGKGDLMTFIFQLS